MNPSTSTTQTSSSPTLLPSAPPNVNPSSSATEDLFSPSVLNLSFDHLKPLPQFMPFISNKHFTFMTESLERANSQLRDIILSGPSSVRAPKPLPNHYPPNQLNTLLLLLEKLAKSAPFLFKGIEPPYKEIYLCGDEILRTRISRHLVELNAKLDVTMNLEKITDSIKKDDSPTIPKRFLDLIDKESGIILRLLLSKYTDLLDVPVKELLKAPCQKKRDEILRNFPYPIRLETLKKSVLSTLFLHISSLNPEDQKALLSLWQELYDGYFETAQKIYGVLDDRLKKLIPLKIEPTILWQMSIETPTVSVSVPAEAHLKSLYERWHTSAKMTLEEIHTIEDISMFSNQPVPDLFAHANRKLGVYQKVLKRELSFLPSLMEEPEQLIFLKADRLKKALNLQCPLLQELIDTVDMVLNNVPYATSNTLKTEDKIAFLDFQKRQNVFKNFQNVQREILEQLKLPSFNIQFTSNDDISERAYEQLLIELSEQKPLHPLKIDAIEEKKEDAELAVPLPPAPSSEVDRFNNPFALSLTHLSLSWQNKHPQIDPTLFQEIKDHAILAGLGVDLYCQLAQMRQDPSLPFHFVMIDIYIALEQLLTFQLLSQGKEPPLRHSLLALAKLNSNRFEQDELDLLKLFDQALLEARYPEEYPNRKLIKTFKSLSFNPTKKVVSEGFQIVSKSYNTLLKLLLSQTVPDVTPPPFEDAQKIDGHLCPQKKLLEKALSKFNGPVQASIKEARHFLFLIARAFELRNDSRLPQRALHFYLSRAALHTDKLFKHLASALCSLNDMPNIASHSLCLYFNLLKEVNKCPFSDPEIGLLSSLNLGIAHHYHTLLKPPLRAPLLSLLPPSPKPEEFLPIFRNIEQALEEFLPRLLDLILKQSQQSVFIKG